MSFLIDHYACYNNQYLALQQHCDVTDKEWKLLCHIFVGGVFSHLKDEEGYMPISSAFLKKHFRNSSIWNSLSDKGLIKVTGYSKLYKKCRRFKVNSEVYQIFFDNRSEPGTDFRVNLITGKKTVRKGRTSHYDRSRHKHPIDIINSLKSITTCVYNRQAILDHLDLIKHNMTQATKQYIFEPNETNKKAMTLAKGRYQTDSACFNHIEVNSEPVDDVEYVYTPQYRVAETGRIYEVGGGLQSCSKAMKHAAFGDLEDVHNYDLRSSQAFGLIQQIEVIGVDDVWLRQYVKNPKLKYEYAEQVGISIECWKDCLYAIFFGACSYKAVKYGSIYKILLEEKEDDSKEAIAAYKKLLKILLPFRQSLGLWHAWLAKDYVDMNATWSNGHVISNAAGKSLNVTKLQQEAEELGDKGLVKRRIAAFILQGFESAFIHHLSHLAKEYDYQVLSNQHDGLVTRGIIPREAILEAAKRSKLKYAYLEEKPFV